SPVPTSTARSRTTTSTRTCSSSGTSARPPTPSRAIPATPPSSARIWRRDRKSTRLNSSHVSISYAVFCLKKKNVSSLTQTRHHLTRNSISSYVLVIASPPTYIYTLSLHDALPISSPVPTSTARSRTTTSTRTCSSSGTSARPPTPSRAIPATPPSSARIWR